MDREINIKERSRERMELRIHAEETLRAVIDWVEAVKPSQWLPMVGSKEQAGYVTDEGLKAQWRDYIDKAGALIGRCWKPAELLIDDLTSFMEEVCAKPKSTSESK